MKNDKIIHKQISQCTENIDVLFMGCDDKTADPCEEPGAIKMAYVEVYQQGQKAQNLLRPRKGMKLPRVLTESEVSRLLQAPDNLKHRCILMLIYSGGLRLGEVIPLRREDSPKRKA